MASYLFGIKVDKPKFTFAKQNYNFSPFLFLLKAFDRKKKNKIHATNCS